MARIEARIEDRLAQNRYVVDAGRPHIRVVPHTIPSPVLRALVHACPAGCYAETDRGTVEVAPDGCMECGTCRVLTQATGEVEWKWPRGGYGVLFKFG